MNAAWKYWRQHDERITAQTDSTRILGGDATIGDMLDALDAGADMPNNNDPRIVWFLDRPDVLLDTDFDADADVALCVTHIERKGIQ